MIAFTTCFRLTLGLTLGAALCGCLSLKPAVNATRHFVLSPIPPAENPPPATPLAVGVGPVKIPSYLFPRAMAVRRGASEIQYLEQIAWAERLDLGFQRVLAANLSRLLPSDQVRLPSWRREDVALEVHLALEQFEVEVQGTGTLVASWRITSPGGERVLQNGRTRLSRSGPSPDANPEGATATLSELAAELSRQLAATLPKAAAPGGQ